jgi:hypothetical protein
MKGDKGMFIPALSSSFAKSLCLEFSGTLLGFDDYVSKYSKLLSLKRFSNDNTDMVLEDVTELYVPWRVYPR